MTILNTIYLELWDKNKSVLPIKMINNSPATFEASKTWFGTNSTRTETNRKFEIVGTFFTP